MMTRMMMILFALIATAVHAQDAPKFDAGTLLKNGLYHERYSGDLEQAKTFFQKALGHPRSTDDIKCKAQLGLASCDIKGGDKKTGQKLLAKTIEAFPELTLKYVKLFDTLPRKPSKRSNQAGEVPGVDLRRKLDDLVIPKIRFEDAEVSEVFQFLKDESKRLDPEKTGVNFLLILSPPEPVNNFGDTDGDLDDWGDDDDDDDDDDDEDQDDDDDDDDDDDQDDDDQDDDDDDEEDEEDEDELQEPTVTMDFDNIPVGQAIRYICEQSNLRYKIEERAVYILAPDMSNYDLELRFFPIDPRIFRMDFEDEDEPVDYKEFFKRMGVTWPGTTHGERATISYDRGTSQLIVRNTPENIRLMEQILRYYDTPLPTVYFKIQLVEVNVPDAMLKRIRTYAMDEFIAELPTNLKHELVNVSLAGATGQAVELSQSETFKMWGKMCSADYKFAAVPQVGNDNFTIASEITWAVKITESGPNQAPLTVFNSKLSKTLSLWDNEGVCFQLTSTGQELKRGAVFLVITPAIVDPTMGSLRKEKEPMGGWLRVRTAPGLIEGP